MRILAFDPSSSAVGWCFGFDDQNAPSLSGVYKPKRGSADVRLIRIYDWTRKLMVRLMPDLVGVEEPAGDHGNRRVDRLLANVTGLIFAASIEAHAGDFIRIYPAQVKKTECSKENLVYAAAFCGKPEVGPDEADAIGVWIATTTEIRKRKMLQQEVYRLQKTIGELSGEIQ